MSKKSTKKALLLSALAMFACVAMLIGSTFAWFTDSVTSAGNKIQAGTLKIDLELLKNGNWVSIKDNPQPIFSYDKWEPGYTDVKILKIENEGTLALRWVAQFQSNVELSALANVIDVYVKTSETAIGYPADRNLEGYTKVGTVADFVNTIEATTNGTLLAGKAAYMASALKMQESAGNEYQGLSLGEFDIRIFATQYTYEEDSFDEQYDAGAPWFGDVDTAWYVDGQDEFVLKSGAELAGFAALVNEGNSFAGKTIKLANSIDLNDKAWTAIGNWDNAFEGDFDGQGHTIYNLSINAPQGEGVGLFGVVAGSAIENVNLCNVDINAYSMVAGLVGAAYPATIENCHVSGDVNIVSEWAYVAGIAGYCYYGTQVDACSVIGNDDSLIQSVTRNAVGGITAWLLEGNHNVTNCSVKNLDLIGWTNVGGITGFVHYNNTISGCSVEDVNLIKTRADGNPGIGLIAGGYSYSANNAITLKDNSVKNVSLSGNHIAYASYNVLYGSEYGGATAANFELVNNTVSGIDNNLVEVVKVTTAADLKAALLAGGNIVLGKNITMESVYITNPNFVLDGNGYTITQSGTNTYALIDTQGGSVTLKNVTFDGINGGAVVRTVGAKFNASNVTVQNSNHTQQQGLFRLMGESTIENCVFKNNVCSMAITLNYDGANNDPQIVKNCVFENNTCNGTAVVYYVKGAGCTLDGNKFIGNTVNCNKNGATVYMGFTEGNVITNNLFMNNNVTDATTYKRVAGGLMIGYATEISGNAFIGNTVSNADGTATGNDVCASVYYTDIDLSGNYWGGNAPVADDDYFVEYPDRHTVIINDYLTENPFA